MQHRLHLDKTDLFIDQEYKSVHQCGYSNQTRFLKCALSYLLCRGIINITLHVFCDTNDIRYTVIYTVTLRNFFLNNFYVLSDIK